MAKSVMPKSKAKTAYGLLSEIRKLIIEEPRRYHQNLWSTDPYAIGGDKFMPDCGTVCCIAGWVKTLKKPEDPNSGRMTGIIAAEVLGLGNTEAYQLFNHAAAGDRRDKAMQTTMASVRAHARRGAAHITRFQKKYAAQLKAKRV